MKSFIASQIKEIATDEILEAVENGDAMATARRLREEILAGWKAALEASGMPAELMATLIIKP